MKRTLLFISTVAIVASSFGQGDCTRPFISEYVEGFGNNKAIEIYNPTDKELDMSKYFLQRYNNGALVAKPEGEFQAGTIQLKGKVASKSTIVYVIDMRDPSGTGQTAPIWKELEEKADEFLCDNYDVNNVMFFNGDDAMVLGRGDAKDPTQGVLLDIFGKIGERPTDGWSTKPPYNNSTGDADDIVVTKDHSMIRKEAIKKGFTPNPPIGATWNPLEEWDSIPARLPKLDENGDTLYQANGTTPQWVGNWNSLGQHKCDCINIKADPDEGEEGKGSNDTTVNITDVDWNSIHLYPNPSNGDFLAIGVDDIETIQVYNALGQEIYRKDNKSHPIISISLGVPSGVYLIKLTHKNSSEATKRLIIK